MICQTLLSTTLCIKGWKNPGHTSFKVCHFYKNPSEDLNSQVLREIFCELSVIVEDG